MEVKLPEARKAQYDNLLNSAQQLEMTIGSNQFRIAKLIDMRKELEVTLKKWWDETLLELKLEANRDYMISKDGTVQDVTKQPPTPAAPTVAPANISELK